MARYWTDRIFARTECHRALRVYESVVDERPDLHGRPLYQEVVRRCAGGESDRALGIVRRAADSFAAWPADREVCFRDVVTYMLVEELLASTHRQCLATDIERIVARIIPGRL